MKNYGFVKHGIFSVYVTNGSGGERTEFHSWRNAYRYFRYMLSFNGYAGGSIYFSGGHYGYYRHFYIVRRYCGVTVWGDDYV